MTHQSNESQRPIDYDHYRRVAAEERSRVRSEMLLAGGRAACQAIVIVVRRFITALRATDRPTRRIRAKALALG